MPDKFPKQPDYTTLQRQIDELKRQVRELGGQTRARATSISGEGSVVIKGGGNLTLEDGGDIIIDDGGNLVIKNGGVVDVEDGGAFYLKGGTLYTIDPSSGQIYGFHGFIVNIPDPDGRPQAGFAFYRNSGSNSLALALYDPFPTDSDGYAQAFHVFDSGGHVILKDDPLGEGLSEPVVPLSMFEGGDGQGDDAIQEITDTFTGIPQAPAGDWNRAIGTAHGRRQHPRVRVRGSIVVSSGAVTGFVSITVNEDQLYATSITGSFYVDQVVDTSWIPYGQEVRVKLRVRRTDTNAGEGLWVRMFHAQGEGR